MAAEQKRRCPQKVSVRFDIRNDAADNTQKLYVDFDCGKYIINPSYPPRIFLSEARTTIAPAYKIKYFGVIPGGEHRFIIKWYAYDYTKQYEVLILNERPLQFTTLQFDYLFKIDPHRNTSFVKLLSTDKTSCSSVSVNCHFVDSTTNVFLYETGLSVPSSLSLSRFITCIALTVLHTADRSERHCGYNKIVSLCRVDKEGIPTGLDLSTDWEHEFKHAGVYKIGCDKIDPNGDVVIPYSFTSVAPPINHERPDTQISNSASSGIVQIFNNTSSSSSFTPPETKIEKEIVWIPGRPEEEEVDYPNSGDEYYEEESSSSTDPPVVKKRRRLLKTVPNKQPELSFEEATYDAQLDISKVHKNIKSY